MVKNDICLGSTSKENALFQKVCPKKRTHMPPMSIIGPTCTEPYELFKSHKVVKIAANTK